MIYVVALLVMGLVFGFLKMISVSTKIIIKLVWNSLLGLLILFVFNIFGGMFGVNIEQTIPNALIAGLLGVPGILLLLIFK